MKKIIIKEGEEVFLGRWCADDLRTAQILEKFGYRFTDNQGWGNEALAAYFECPKGYSAEIREYEESPADVLLIPLMD